MPRKIIVTTPDNATHLLDEAPVANEEELCSLVKDNPGLLPIEEFGLSGPIMVVGRETTLASGAVDLVCVTASGELLVIEFKTGPQNPDFRRALAQLIDYGSDLWGMSYEAFERTVAARYFSSDFCKEESVRGLASLDLALRVVWPQFSEEDSSLFRDHLAHQLAQGSFNYVLVASGFTKSVDKSIEYLNTIGSMAKFFAVELVPFAGSGLTAFESRTRVRPLQRPPPSGYTDESGFLSQVQDEDYREVLRKLLDLCRGLGISVPWGSIGASIRVSTSDMSEPLSIGWLFPPGRKGWSGLTDITLGVDIASASMRPSVQEAIEKYLSRIQALPGAEQTTSKGLTAFRFAPESFIEIQEEVSETLENLINDINAGGTVGE